MSCKKGLVSHQRTRIFILTDDNGTKRWDQISEITDVSPPKASFAEDDVTTLEDTDKTIVTAGPREHSNPEITLLEISGDEMQKRLYLSNYNGTCERFKIVKPDELETTYEFCAYISEFGDETDPAKKTRIAMTLTISGKVGKYNKHGYITPDFITMGPGLTFTPPTPPTPAPSVTSLTITPTAFDSTNNTGTITVVFDQVVSGFTDAMLTAQHGIISNLTTSDNQTWTADYTANTGVNLTTGVITVSAGYTNSDGTAGASAKSDAYAVNTV